MSYELLAFDLELLLERLQDGTDFPYGDGDERLINNINQTARTLRLPEPIEARISESSVYFEVRRWGTGEKAASEYHAQLIAMIIDGEAVYEHRNAMRGPGACVLNTLRDWLNEAKRQRLVQMIEKEPPRYSEPTGTLTPIQNAMRTILLDKAQAEGPEARMSSGELMFSLRKLGISNVSAAQISKSANALTKKGCECRSGGPHGGYRLIPLGRLVHGDGELATSGKKLARTGS